MTCCQLGESSLFYSNQSYRWPFLFHLKGWCHKWEHFDHSWTQVSSDKQSFFFHLEYLKSFEGSLSLIQPILIADVTGVSTDVKSVTAQCCDAVSPRVPAQHHLHLHHGQGPGGSHLLPRLGGRALGLQTGRRQGLWPATHHLTGHYIIFSTDNKFCYGISL